MSTNASIEIEPLISYPRIATVGKSYVMTVDVRQASLESEWPYEAEEYTVHLMLDSLPLFESEPIGDPSVVLHRFGGTYGPATFLLTANQQEMQGNMRLTLVNDAGLPVDVIEIPGIRVTAEEQKGTTRSVRVKKESVVVPAARQIIEEQRSESELPEPVRGDSKPGSKAPPGFRLLRTLDPDDRLVNRIAWAPDRKILAVPSQAQIWNVETGRRLRSLKSASSIDELIGPVSFSPDGKLFAVDSRRDGSIEIYETQGFSLLRKIMKDPRRAMDIWSFAWSPDSRRLAAGSGDLDLSIWNVETGALLSEVKELLIRNIDWSPVDDRRLAIGTNYGVAVMDPEDADALQWFGGEPDFEQGFSIDWVYKVCWSPDGKLLAAGGAPQTARLWDLQTGKEVATLEGYKRPVTGLSFSADGRLLAATTNFGAVKLWRCDTWELVAQLDRKSIGTRVFTPVFHPTQPLLAGVDEERIHIWEVDVDEILGSSRAEEPAAVPQYVYSTAKVVLLGDSGSGKSALAQRLTSDAFTPTTATHGMQVWLWKSETTTENGSTVTREIMLWDLGGQPDYRLLLPLFLENTSVAVIVFGDSYKSFASVPFWDSVVRHARRQSALPIARVLVASKTDKAGGPEITVDMQASQLGFDAYCTTSAKTGTGITKLAETIEKLIDWEKLPRTSADLISKYIRDFLMSERESGTVMRATVELFEDFLSFLDGTEYEPLTASLNRKKNDKSRSELLRYFEAYIGTMETAGILMRLDDYILLHVEVISVYASAIINAVRSDPDELGSIGEQTVLQSRFGMPPDQRIKDEKHEKILIKGTVDAFARNEIMCRVQRNGKQLMVFPSLIVRENSELENRHDASLRLDFRGVVDNVWARLCVRFSKDDRFDNTGMWRNAASYVSSRDITCTVVLRKFSSEQGQVALFVDNVTNPAERIPFEKILYEQLGVLAIGIRRHERLKIYVSSPFAGLQEYRQTVFDAVRELGHETAFAEEPNTVQSRSLEWMRQAIAECDVYICLLAWYRGYVPDLKDGKSIVEVEYETARELNKRVLVFLRDPMSDPGQYESSRELESFRQQLSLEQHCEYFTTAEDLAAKVKFTLINQSFPID